MISQSTRPFGKSQLVWEPHPPQVKKKKETGKEKIMNKYSASEREWEPSSALSPWLFHIQFCYGYCHVLISYLCSEFPTSNSCRLCLCISFRGYMGLLRVCERFLFGHFEMCKSLFVVNLNLYKYGLNLTPSWKGTSVSLKRNCKVLGHGALRVGCYSNVDLECE